MAKVGLKFGVLGQDVREKGFPFEISSWDFKTSSKVCAVLGVRDGDWFTLKVNPSANNVSFGKLLSVIFEITFSGCLASSSIAIRELLFS